MTNGRKLKIQSGSLELPAGTEFKLYKGADLMTGNQIFGALLTRESGRMARYGNPPRSVALNGNEEFIITKKIKPKKATSSAEPEGVQAFV